MENQTNNCAPRELTGNRLYGYASGMLAQVLPTTLITAYIFNYYVYTVGLDSVLVGIGTAMGAILNALGGPLFGILSDRRKPNKWGKRRPFLILSLPILLLSLVLVWIPPSYASPTQPDDYRIAIYLWVLLGAFFISYPMMRSPYLAMLSDQSHEEKNRVKISSIQGIFSIVGALLGIVLPMILQSQLNDPKQAFHTTEDGQYLIHALPIIAIAFGVISTIVILLTFFSVDESFLIEEHCDASENLTISAVFSNIAQPFQDKRYSRFLFSTLFTNTSMRMITKILAPFLTFVLLLEGNEFNFFTFGLIPAAGLGFVFWQKQAKKNGLKATFIQALSVVGFFLLLTIVSLIDFGKTTRIVIVFIIICFALSGMVSGYLLPNPLISRVCDLAQNDSSQKESISGKYFGTYLFILNIANAIGDFLMGWILSGHEEDPLFLGLILPLTGVFYVVAILIFRKISLE